MESPTSSMERVRPPSSDVSLVASSTTGDSFLEEGIWFLQPDHQDELQIELDDGGAPTVKGGTASGLVAYLTRHDKLDATFNHIFLLTYRSFMTSPQLFGFLMERFYIQPPDGLTQAEYQIWLFQKKKITQVRVINVLKRWLDNFWTEPDDQDTKNLLRKIREFTIDSIPILKSSVLHSLITVVEQRLQGDRRASIRERVSIQGATSPPPVLPKQIKKIKFLDISPVEMARQLTLLESQLYNGIRLEECVNKAWQKKAMRPGEVEPAPNIRSMIQNSNKLANWVGELVLLQPELKKRVRVIKHFVDVLEACYEMKNYSTSIAIVSGLGTAPIYRLARTWSQVSERSMATFERIRCLVNSTKNFNVYRETMSAAHPPCVPFLGVFLMDLTFIEDGNPSQTPSGMINFSKRSKAAAVIQDLQRYQASNYSFQPVPELQDYLVSSVEAAEDINEKHDRSLELEPRTRAESNGGGAPYVSTGSHMGAILMASMAME
ncbi:Cell division control protein 25 [Talaromyces islandicus]|uniref:Cell division control protein 25 n=1 Tax=Talaromyces islandicus TaxID=28573 RepID=A0A0U1LJ96_TALIS|nr:Cell division control protein 25 [Talaromyces islandicus]